MAKITKTYTGNNGGSYVLTLNTTNDSMTVTGSTFKANALMPTSATLKLTKQYMAQALFEAQVQAIKVGGVLTWKSTTDLKSGSNQGYPVAWANGATKALLTEVLTGQNIQTSALFDASNKSQNYVDVDMVIQFNQAYLCGESDDIIDELTGMADLSFGSRIYLNAPPTFSAGAMSFDTGTAYAGITTASVTVSNLSAKYGGDIDSVVLTIGTQTASRSNNGTLSILLDTVGTFTPMITVTDSRGQTTTQMLPDITVNTYTAPTVSFSAERTTSAGIPDDEGTYATMDATFIFSDVIATAAAPSVVVTDQNGTQTTPVVSWYSSRAADGTLSGSVNWAGLSSGDTVYGLIPNLNTQQSYQIAIRPRDSIGTGTAITQTLASAFYTIDFLAGGHGIAFGQPASQTGFYCNMDAHFVDKADVMRALFDFVYPVGSYYETSDTSFNPNVTWGGTWSLETEGLVHIGAGANYTAGDTGGSADAIIPYHNHSVSAVTNGITGGSHTHKQQGWNGLKSASSGTAKEVRSRYIISGDPQETGNIIASTHTHNLPAHNTDYAGTSGNAVGANMQPYIVVNRWHRTA